MSKKRYFERYAARWDELQHEVDPEQLEYLVGRFEIQKGDWILDVGTGTGILLPYLALSAQKEGRIFALDFSAQMLSVARSKIKTKTVSFIHSAVETIPLKDETFDRVVCFACFPHFENKQKALLEMGRVSKPGGKLFIAHLLSSQQIKEHHLRAGGDVKNDVLPSNPILEKMMIRAGFREIKIVDQPSLYLARGEKG